MPGSPGQGILDSGHGGQGLLLLGRLVRGLVGATMAIRFVETREKPGA